MLKTLTVGGKNDEQDKKGPGVQREKRRKMVQKKPLTKKHIGPEKRKLTFHNQLKELISFVGKGKRATLHGGGCNHAECVKSRKAFSRGVLKIKGSSARA